MLVVNKGRRAFADGSIIPLGCACVVVCVGYTAFLPTPLHSSRSTTPNSQSAFCRLGERRHSRFLDEFFVAVVEVIVSVNEHKV